MLKFAWLIWQFAIVLFSLLVVALLLLFVGVAIYNLITEAMKELKK